jgi:ATP-dependent DNA helicase RecG
MALPIALVSTRDRQAVCATTVAEINTWLLTRENEHWEFKAARTNYDYKELVKYCCALANEGGGRLILGVTDKIPRQVEGTSAFQNLESTKEGVLNSLNRQIRVDIDDVAHPNGRVLVFNIPSRPLGVPLQFEGVYYMRAGEALVPMPAERLQRVFAEATPDFSARVCQNATMGDLDPAAIKKFRDTWTRKSGNLLLAQSTDDQLLKDAELVIDGGITYAALILLGTGSSLVRNLAQAEVIFEYRADETSIGAHQRKDYREGFFLFYDDIWNEINLRNDKQQYQEDQLMLDIQTFDESAVREAIQNAVCHRDYQLPGSVLINQYPRKMLVTSPGGLLPGITPENILSQHVPRNRRIAEALQKCGLVERSGQGIDRMFEQSIRQGKLLPKFEGTDSHRVVLTLEGQLQDPKFVSFLSKIAAQTGVNFGLDDLLILDCIHKEEVVPVRFKSRLSFLKEQGIVEYIGGKGRGSKTILSRKFYVFAKKPGEYTKKRGLGKETNKQLLLGHLKQYKAASINDLQQVLPALSRAQVQNLLKELRKEHRIEKTGDKRGTKWELTS